MQGLTAYTGARCPSIGQHCSGWSADSNRVGSRFSRLCAVPNHGKYPRCKAAAVPLTRHGRKPEWRCSATAEGEAFTEEPALSVQEKLVETLGEIVETVNELVAEEGPTVQVKFVLQKECHFGQKFNVVGNIPLLGDWDPQAAIPMVWNEGHVWIVEVDVPVGKQIEFKLVLTGKRGEVEWQPGPNRILDALESATPLVVLEVWDADVADVIFEDVPKELSDLVEETEIGVAAEIGAAAGVGVAAGVELGVAAGIEIGVAAGIATKEVLDEAASEEVAAETGSKIGEVNGQLPLFDYVARDESETASEIPPGIALVAVGLDGVPDGNTVA